MALRKNNISVNDQFIKSFISSKTDEISLYIKILQQVSNASNSRVTIGTFLLEDDKDGLVKKNTSIPWRDYEFIPDLESNLNFIEQGYEYLKTLPEFAGCEDC